MLKIDLLYICKFKVLVLQKLRPKIKLIIKFNVYDLYEFIKIKMTEL
jgi:hypothetical protein